MEVFHSMSQSPVVDCPECESTMKKQLGTGAGIIFKGGGFYETDFKDKKGSPDKTESKETSSSDRESKKDSKAKSESKTSEKTTKAAKPSKEAATA